MSRRRRPLSTGRVPRPLSATAWVAPVVVLAVLLGTAPATATDLPGDEAPAASPTAVATPGTDPTAGTEPVTGTDPTTAPEPAGQPAPGSVPAGATAVAPSTGTSAGDEPQPSAEPPAETEPTPVPVVKAPGPGSGVVRALRRSLRAADRGERVPKRVRPLAKNLRKDVRTLPAGCTASPGEDRHQICVRGIPDSEKTVVVFGNSHMAMWLAGLEPQAARRDVRLVPFIKYGCSPYRFQMIRGTSKWRECSRWREWAIKQIRGMRPDLVIVASHTWLKLARPDGRIVSDGRAWNQQWRSGVQKTSEALARRADRVVVLGDTTTRDLSPVGCAKTRGATMKTCEQRISARTRTLLRLTKQGARRGNAQYLDMNAFTCLDGRCPVVAGGTYVFRDTLGHITATYARQVSRAFAGSLRLGR